jgi:uncharacterized membrane protein
VATKEPSRSLLWPAVLVGIGVAGSLDEIVLHQLLHCTTSMTGAARPPD